MRRADAALLVAAVVGGAVASGVVLGREGGPFPLWAATLIGAVVGLAACTWVRVKRAAGRGARERGAELRGRRKRGS